MELSGLKLNRYMYKNEAIPLQEGPIYMSENIYSKANMDKKSERFDPKDARQIITGTVITDCIIQTSGLPHRVLIQDNDVTFFDDTTGGGGEIKGDTSRLIFRSAFREEGSFIMEKRVSVNDTLDSVLSWYAIAPVEGHHNWLFIGRDGVDSPASKNLSVFRIGVNGKTDDVPANGKPYGSFSVEYSEEEVLQGITIFGGASRNFIGAGLSGFSSFISAGDGGLAGLSYFDLALQSQNVLLYLLSKNEIMLGAKLLPDATNAYDIGSASFRIKTIYTVNAVNVSSDIRFKEDVAPLGDSLDLIKRIEPISYTRKGEDRVHYGFSAQQLQEILPIIVSENNGELSITPDEIVPVLLKAVKELSEKVEKLEAYLNK